MRRSPARPHQADARSAAGPGRTRCHRSGTPTQARQPCAGELPCSCWSAAGVHGEDRLPCGPKWFSGSAALASGQLLRSVPGQHTVTSGRARGKGELERSTAHRNELGVLAEELAKRLREVQARGELLDAERAMFDLAASASWSISARADMMRAAGWPPFPGCPSRTRGAGGQPDGAQGLRCDRSAGRHRRTAHTGTRHGHAGELEHANSPFLIRYRGQRRAAGDRRPRDRVSGQDNPGLC